MDIRRRFTYDYNINSGIIPNNQIWYTSSDGNVVTPNKTNVFGANITNNVYINGVGYLTFAGPVTTIGARAFYSCHSLISVTIPNSVTTIGEYAFYDCTSLESVTIPESVTNIGDYAFRNCDSLISVTIPNSVTTIGEYAFANSESLTSVTIPDSVTTIGTGAFYYCTSLTSVNIPDSLTEIGDSAFYGCNNLPIYKYIRYADTYAVKTSSNKNTYSFKSGTRFIGSSFTYNNRLLTSIEIPEGVISVGDSAFSNCNKLTTVTLPSSIIKIGNHAFFNTTSISLVCKATIPPLLGGDMFGSLLSLNKLTIYVPKESVDSYKSHAGWSAYADRIFEMSPYL